MALQCDALPADVVASAGRLPWRDESFDCVLAPHLPDDDAPLLLALAELFRVVQPQGGGGADGVKSAFGVALVAGRRLA